MLFDIWLGEGNWDFVADSKAYMLHLHPWHVNMHVEAIAKIKDTGKYAWFVSAYDGYSPDLGEHIWTVAEYGIANTKEQAEQQLIYMVTKFYNKVHGVNPGEPLDKLEDWDFLLQSYPWWSE